VQRRAKQASVQQPARKDFFVASLKTQLALLWEENQKLKEAAKARLPPAAAASLLAGCITAQPSVLDDEVIGQAYAKQDATLLRVLRDAQRSYVITDPRQLDNPIVWVSPNFCTLTGYAREEILGRNCRFLQGPATDQAVVGRIRRALDKRFPDSLCLVNYRKDGTPFWNNLYISPLLNQQNEVVHYIGVQCDVTAAYCPDGALPLPGGDGGSVEGLSMLTAADVPGYQESTAAFPVSFRTGTDVGTTAR